MKPKLSIVIPCYNAAPYLDRCMSSLCNQTLKNCEVIVVDDSSSDGSREKVEKNLRFFPFGRLIKSESHIGTGAARNIGLEHATGTYVAFLDADDWVDTDAYRKMCEAMDAVRSDIAVCGIRTEFGSPFQSTIRYQYPSPNSISGRFALKLLCRTEMQDSFISPMPGNKVFRIEFLKKHQLKFPPRRLWEDDVFMFLAFRYAGCVSIVHDAYQHYFQHGDSVSHLFSREHIDTFLLSFEEIHDALKRDGKWSEYENEFYAYMDRGLNSLLDVMFAKEQRISDQRAYMAVLVKGLIDTFSIEELLAHIDPKRIQRLWL